MEQIVTSKLKVQYFQQLWFYIDGKHVYFSKNKDTLNLLRLSQRGKVDVFCPAKTFQNIENRMFESIIPMKNHIGFSVSNSLEDSLFIFETCLMLET